MKTINTFLLLLSFMLIANSEGDSVVKTTEDYQNSEIKNIKVYLSGEIKNPMTAILPRQTTLKDAIDHVGGGKKLAALDKIILMRKGKLWRYDLGKNDHQKIKLEPFDLIFVPQQKIIGK